MHPDLQDDEDCDMYAQLQQSRESWVALIVRCENDPAICEMVGTWMCFGAGIDSFKKRSKPDFSSPTINTAKLIN